MNHSRIALALLLVTACNRDKPAEPVPANAPTVKTTSAESPQSNTSRVRYLERMTGGAEVADAVPVVIAIHGLGDRPESFGRLFDGLSARARQNLAVCPRRAHVVERS